MGHWASLCLASEVPENLTYSILLSIRTMRSLNYLQQYICVTVLVVWCSFTLRGTFPLLTAYRGEKLMSDRCFPPRRSQLVGAHTDFGEIFKKSHTKISTLRSNVFAFLLPKLKQLWFAQHSVLLSPIIFWIRYIAKRTAVPYDHVLHERNRIEQWNFFYTFRTFAFCTLSY